ncbi:hypothetical protein [Caviibacterium pharyngocola]|uniref:hypothetical protein n=1 Tax=Caviibacterium pharyngocola TaxID=28159 RepID=UPI0013FDF07E|nr:hypothetical protein [Caviibacterium pharyngocola]
MAAEKLTKKRLIQILIMLCILLFAFVYKTCSYEKNETGKSAVENQQVYAEK